MIKRSSDMTSERREELRGGSGHIDLYHILTKDEMYDKARLFCEMTVEPGCSVGEHPHDPDMEVYYMLEGTLTAYDNGEKTQFNKGDVMVTGGGQTHSVVNETDKKAVVLAVIML